VILFSRIVTPRLQYIAGFIGNEITGKGIKLTSSLDDFNDYKGIRVNYSNEKLTDDDIWIKPHGLLFENGISEQKIDCFEINDQKAFFKTTGDFLFDIFAASFYLLSRYEEYLPHQKDEYGRYAYQNSLAYKQGFLKQPLVNIWVKEFRKALKEKFPSFTIQFSSFTFLPTYDIDMAWSYRHKGRWRNFGGILKFLLSGNWNQLIERIRVLSGKQKDPFDSYGWMNHLHEQYKLKPYYFFLVTNKKGRYDKNISPSVKAMQELIHDHVIRYPVGIHPSWQSGDTDVLLKNEIDTLSKFTGSEVLSSRQHYIRFTIPETFRRLINHGIRFDFSMGYGSVNGFRASVASPFSWYDLENEKQTELMLFPFCFMDANSLYEQKFTPQQALEEMRYYYKSVKSMNGMLIIIWHNSFLGTGREFRGWREVYKQFIEETTI
jgi:Family of unknown function (DUF7033)